MTAEEAECRINNRCLDKYFPNVSDILGSDWIAVYGLQQRTPEQYRKLAIDHAYATLPTMWKSGKPLID